MKFFRIIFALAFPISMISCTVPTSSDFKQSDDPLSDKEFVVEWRLSKDASYKEAYPHTYLEVEKAARFVDPLFRQFIPRVFADIKAGKLTLYEGSSLEEGIGAPITHVSKQMAEAYGANWQRLESFMKVFHFRERRHYAQNGPVKNILELVLITSDPEETRPERYFGAIRMQDLIDLDYEFEFEGEEYKLIDYLSEIAFYKMYPTRMAMHAESASLVALDEAYHVKDKIAEGNFGELKFLDERLNSAKLNPVILPVETMAKFQGIFEFQQDGKILRSEDNEKIFLTISQQGDELTAQWSHFFLPQRLFAADKNKLFSLHGWILDFTTDSDGTTQVKLSDSFEHVEEAAVVGVPASNE